MAKARLVWFAYIDESVSTPNGSVNPPSARAVDPSLWVSRATRLRVGAPVAYRSVFDERWATGSTIDISRTGVLFLAADADIPVSPDLQVVIYLSRAEVAMYGVPLPMPDLYCGGRLARIEGEASGARRAVAMQIDFEWAEAPPGRLWETGLMTD